MLVARGQHAVARAQGSALTSRLSPSLDAVGERDVVGVRDDHRGDGRAGLPHPFQDLGQQVGQAAADRELALRLLVHRALGLGRHRPGGPCVEVDAGARRGQQTPDRGHLGRLRHEGGDHVRIISTPPARTVTPRSEDPVAGFARPELIATPGVAGREHRPARPAGDRRALASRRQRARRSTAPATSRAPSSSTGEPGRRRRRRRRRAAPRRARPHGRRDVQGRRRGRDAAVLYDDTLSYFASRVWWSLRAYGYESARILEAASPPGSRPGTTSPTGRSGPLGDLHAARAGAPAADHGRRARRCSARRTCCCRRARAGRVPRLRGQRPSPRAHPGRGQHAGRLVPHAGDPADARRRRAARPAAQDEHHPRSAPRLLRRLRAWRPPSWPTC